jgi:hypothetical protein
MTGDEDDSGLSPLLLDKEGEREQSLWGDVTRCYTAKPPSSLISDLLLLPARYIHDTKLCED